MMQKEAMRTLTRTDAGAVDRLPMDSYPLRPPMISLNFVEGFSSIFTDNLPLSSGDSPRCLFDF